MKIGDTITTKDPDNPYISIYKRSFEGTVMDILPSQSCMDKDIYIVSDKNGIIYQINENDIKG